MKSPVKMSIAIVFLGAYIITYWPVFIDDEPCQPRLPTFEFSAISLFVYGFFLLPLLTPLIILGFDRIKEKKSGQREWGYFLDGIVVVLLIVSGRNFVGGLGFFSLGDTCFS